MTADAPVIFGHDAATAGYVGEITGYVSEIMTFRDENDAVPMVYGSKSTLTPCFFASLGLNIQYLLAQA